jgi:hypothetical protein
MDGWTSCSYWLDQAPVRPLCSLFEPPGFFRNDPDASMLALTFTTKAADEMRQRLDALMGGRAERAHLCTFHSFAGDVLRQHGSHVGIQPDFSMLANDEDRIAVLEGVIRKLSCDTSALPTDRKNLLFLLDRLFAESYNGEPTAPGMTKTPPWIPPLFKAYCESFNQATASILEHCFILLGCFFRATLALLALPVSHGSMSALTSSKTRTERSMTCLSSSGCGRAPQPFRGG